MNWAKEVERDSHLSLDKHLENQLHHYLANRIEVLSVEMVEEYHCFVHVLHRRKHPVVVA